MKLLETRFVDKDGADDKTWVPELLFVLFIVAVVELWEFIGLSMLMY